MQLSFEINYTLFAAYEFHVLKSVVLVRRTQKRDDDQETMRNTNFNLCCFDARVKFYICNTYVLKSLKRRV